MNMLSLVKTSKGRETYLAEVKNSKHRIAMTKLRLSGHKLEIETGRYSNTAPEDRLCTYCKLMGHNVVEDEIHFLVRCPMYADIREELLTSAIIKDNTMSDKDKFIQLMTVGDLKDTAKFIHNASKERDLQLEVISTMNDLISSTENLLKKYPTPDLREPLCTKTSNSIDVRNTSNSVVYRVKNLSQDGIKMTLYRV